LNSLRTRLQQGQTKLHLSRINKLKEKVTEISTVQKKKKKKTGLERDDRRKEKRRRRERVFNVWWQRI
jgi:hypothetical protein